MVNKKICTLLISLLVFSSTNAPMALANDNITQTQVITQGNNNIVFVDIDNSYDWAKDAINTAAKKGIVSGVGNGKFAPEENVTREQFSKMLVLTFNAPLSSPEVATFSDVPKNTWSFPYIEVSKDFLTGYANPFGGKPAFHPEEAATREDIAVALVKMMGLSDKDIKDSSYAYYRFSDADSISPGLIKYVGLAAERGLIKGYDDGSFGPQRAISRAECVVLLNRATKQAVSTLNEELSLTANLIEGENPQEVTLFIEAEEGTSVTVDGQKVRMDTTEDGYIGGMALYKFAEEGEKVFQVEGIKGAKKKSVRVTATYKLDAPELKVTNCPETAKNQTVTISGTVKDARDKSPKVYINDEEVYVDYSGNWTKEVKLTEGNNSFNIKATNNLDKSTTVTKTVSFGVGAPVIIVTNCPETAATQTVTISGNVKDSNDKSPNVYINDTEVYVDYSGNWTQNVTLSEGDNTFNIKATNSLGKSTTITKTISFGVGAPVLTVTNCPETAATQTVAISGNVKDANDKSPNVYINDKEVYVDYSGNWTQNVTLNEGDNTFNIKATNSLGKSTTITKTISFGVGAPVLNVTNCPETAANQTVTISGTVKDTNDRSPQVYINDKEVYVDYNGNWTSKVTLDEGENSFVIKATNNLGKSSTLTKSISFGAAAPVLNATYMPELTDKSSITIEGTVSDKNDNGVTVVASVYASSNKAYVGYNGNWSATLTLSEGANPVKITATNKFGKTTVIERIITYIKKK